jgi:nucleotide-binding universal stress UspA family protein
MRTIIAALDASAAARPVLETALAVGRLTGASVRAIHVGASRPATLDSLSDQFGVPLELLAEGVEPALLRSIGLPGVIAAVLGARSTPGGRRPAGHTARDILEHTDKPIVVVPPDALRTFDLPLRVLVPLEGSEESSAPIVERLYPLFVEAVEIVVLHVFTADTTPRLLDRPSRDLELWAGEFGARFCPVAARVEWRTGSAGRRITEVCDEEGADLIVLSWSQDLSPGRAATIREVLAHAPVPVLLLPVRERAVPAGLPG